MPTTVKIRRSGTASATPSALEHGEIAINYADGKVFWKDASNVITSFTFQSYALVSHTHAASDITSGTLDAARLPLATTLAAGAVIVGTGLGVSSGTVSVTYGTSSGTACQGNDSRLSDARTPTSHTHGNISNAGAIGSTANLPVITTTSGVLTTGTFGTAASSFCEGNDARLSDTRTPTDNTVSTAKIQNDAVTYAKLQNVSATDRLLGRSSAGAGDVEEITCTSFGRSLIDDADAAAARTTLSVQPTASPAFTGALSCGDTVNIGTASSTNTIVNVGTGATGNRFAITDYIGDTTYTDYGLRVGRENGGANGPSIIQHRGTGVLSINAIDAGSIELATSSTIRATISSTGTATFTGQVRVNTADSSTALLVNGATRGVRFNTSTDGTRIEGVDNTGVGSYQPLILNGSTVTIQSNGGTSAITVGTSQTATFAGQVLVTAGSGSSGSYNPGLAISGDDDTGVMQTTSGGANTLSLVTNGTERLRVDASGNVGIGAAAGSGIALDLYNATGGGLPALRIRDSAVDFRLYTSNAAVVSAISNHPLSFHTNSGEKMVLGTDGSLKAPDVYSDTVGATNRDLFIDSTGLIGYVSSIRESKTDIVTLDDVSWLSALSPVSYRYRKRNADGTYSDEADGVTDYGLIAEDVEAVRPELCFYDDVDGEPQLRGVTYSKLITPMLRYIQQLEQRIAALEERING